MTVPPAARTALALVAIALLPLVADLFRSTGERCELDGAPVREAYRVRVLDAGAGGREHRFCGVRCAGEWLARTGTKAAEVRVTDSVTGAEIDAGAAWYLRSLTIAGETAPDDIRVFARRADAERQASAYGGDLMVGPERPFADVPRTEKSPGRSKQ